MSAETELSSEAHVLRVLHVDDDEDFLELAATRLERERDDLVVEPVSDVSAALARLAAAEGTIECVVSDYDMPSMDGLAFLEAVRALDPDLPFVLLTGRGSESLASRAIAAGVSDYVLKQSSTAPYARLANRIVPLVENYRNRRRAAADRAYLRAFHEITTGAGSRSGFEGGFEATVERLLAIGCERLGFDIGICSRIEDETYEIRAVHVSDAHSDADLAVGDRFSLEATYCEQVVASDEPRGFTDAAAAGFADHPAYESFGLESYLGVPVVIDGRCYGTLNFSSPRRRNEPLTAEEETLIGLMAEWIGNELGRRRANEALERNRDLLDKTQQVSNVGGWELDVRTNDLHVTDETLRIHGLEPGSELDVESGIDFYHPDDQETISEALGRAIEDGESYDLELRIVRADGETRWVRALGEPYSEDGAVVMLRGAFQDVTERVERRERLEATARRLEALVENSPVAIMAIDPAGDVTRWNPAAETLFGWSSEDVLGEANPLVPKAKRDEHRTLRERALDGESVAGVELQRRQKNGSSIDVRLSTAPIRGEDGTVTEIVAFLDDVSARKRYEAELRSTTELLSTLIENLPAGILVENGAETIRLVNQAFCDMFDIDADPEELVGTDPVRAAERMSEQLTEPVEFTSRRRWMIHQRSPILGEEVAVTDGRVFERDYVPVDSGDADESGEYSIWVYNDITERKRYERRLEALHDRTREMMGAETREEVCAIAMETVEQVLDRPISVLWLYDEVESALQLTTCSAAARDLFETLPASVAGSSLLWDAFVAGEPRVYADIEKNQAYNPETSVRSEAIVPLSTYGALTISSTSNDVITNAEVTIAELLATNTEAALARAERTAALREREQWLRAQNERLDEFASIVSHDLRNPLTIAYGWLDVAESEAPTEHHVRVRKALDRMNALIEDVLALARDGRVVRDPAPVSVEEIVAAAWESVETHDASLVVDHPLPAIDGDGDRLVRAFENLFRNAVEHGGPDVTVTVGAFGGESGDGLFVEDSGPGIPPVERESVFEYGRSGTSSGTGFGLAIIEGIAEAHGWRVTATEADGGGARFEFAFDEPV